MATRHRANKDYLTVDEFCADLGIARSTFYDWRAVKKTPPVIKLPNGQLRIRRTAYEAWLAGLEDVA